MQSETLVPRLDSRHINRSMGLRQLVRRMVSILFASSRVYRMLQKLAGIAGRAWAQAVVRGRVESVGNAVLLGDLLQVQNRRVAHRFRNVDLDSVGKWWRRVRRRWTSGRRLRRGPLFLSFDRSRGHRALHLFGSSGVTSVQPPSFYVPLQPVT